LKKAISALLFASQHFYISNLFLLLKFFYVKLEFIVFIASSFQYQLTFSAELGNPAP